MTIVGLHRPPVRATIDGVTSSLPVSRRSLPAALLALVLVAGCGQAPSTAAPSASPSAAPSASPSPSTPPTPSASASAGSADLVALTAEISAQVADLRGLALESPVSPAVVTETAAVELLKAQFRDENAPAYVASEEGLYRRLGLLPRDASLEGLELELLGSQVLGFYQPKSKKLYVVERSGGVGPTERYTMAHEITHALQDQHFDLQKVSPDAPDQSDRTIGAHSLIEGDASLAGTLWATQHLSASDLAAVVAEGSDPTQQAVLAKMPEIVKAPLLFLYTEGLQLTLGLYQSGGWPAVDAALKDPPASSEQVIHPEKYASHEPPVAVSLPPGLAARIGAGWTLALQDTLGELQLRIWLQSSTGSAPLAGAASAGWGGDRVGFLRGPGGADAALLWTTWDSPADAAEFLDAAGRLVADGASPGTVVRASDRAVVAIVASASPIVDAVARAAGLMR